MPLPTNIEESYPEDQSPGAVAHRQYHDFLHALYNAFENIDPALLPQLLMLAAGDLIVGAGANTPERLPLGGPHEGLKVNAAGDGLEYAPLVNTLVDAAGDLLVGAAADTLGRLPLGPALHGLRVNAAGNGLEYAPSGALSTFSGFGSHGGQLSTPLTSRTQFFRATPSNGAPTMAAFRRPVVVDHPGSVVGMALQIENGGSGTIRGEVYINGAATGLTVDALGAVGYGYSSQAAGLDVFAAGDRLDIRAGIDPSFALSSQVEGFITVQYT